MYVFYFLHVCAVISMLVQPCCCPSEYRSGHQSSWWGTHYVVQGQWVQYWGGHQWLDWTHMYTDPVTCPVWPCAPGALDSVWVTPGQCEGAGQARLSPGPFVPLWIVGQQWLQWQQGLLSGVSIHGLTTAGQRSTNCALWLGIRLCTSILKQTKVDYLLGGLVLEVVYFDTEAVSQGKAIL